MLNKYEELNDDARDYFLVLLANKVKDEEILKRCKKEVDLLYNKGLLFILEFLHQYKKTEKSVSFHFRGMANNLLLLYIFGMSKIDPIKYNLPYELFTDKTLCIDFINGCSIDFVDAVEKYARDFRIVKGSFEPTDVDEVNKFADNHYLLIPKYVQPTNITFKLNEFSQLETVEDYHSFTDEYLTIRLDDKILIQEKKVDVKYAMHTEFEEEVSKQLKPKSMDDYVKVISLAHGTKVWKENQDELFKDGKIDIHSVISNREDVYEYLIQHSIEHDVAIDIVKQISKSRTNETNELWKKYVDVMKEHNCDDIFINIISKVLYIFGRGQAVSECLYALDKVNYYMDDYN